MLSSCCSQTSLISSQLTKILALIYGNKTWDLWQSLLFHCSNFHLCEIIPERYFYLWSFIYLLFLWHVPQRLENPPLFSCVYPARSQETEQQHTCLRRRHEGSVGSHRSAPVQQMGAAHFHLPLWSCVNKTVSYRGLQGNHFLLWRCWDGNACWLFSFDSFLVASSELWNAKWLKTHPMPLPVGNIGHRTELPILNYCVCTDNDLPGAILR